MVDSPSRSRSQPDDLGLPQMIERVPSKTKVRLTDDIAEMSLQQACDDVDPNIILKVYRLVGSANGVTLHGLMKICRTLSNNSIRKNVEHLLPLEFVKHDANDDGFLEWIEFEQMINNSLWLKSAVYELTREEDSEIHIHDRDRASQKARHEVLDMLSICVVILSAIVAACRVDVSPHWTGWDYIELAFAIVFTIDLCMRLVLAPSPELKKADDKVETNVDVILGMSRSLGFSQTSPISGCQSDKTLGNIMRSTSNILQQATEVQESCACTLPSYCAKIHALLNRCCGKTRNFLSMKSNVLDAFATVFGWFDLAYVFSSRQNDSFFWASWLRWVRLLRLVRLVARLGRIVTYLKDLAVVLHGVIEGIRLAVWGFVVIAVVLMMWAIFVRSIVVDDKENNYQEILEQVFPNIARTITFLFRCMVVKSDGSCSVQTHGNFLTLISDGLFLEIMWSLTELFIMFVVLNVVSAIYVLQAQENARQVADTVHSHRWKDDEIKLDRLDKLLRSLIYPSRGKDRHPKHRYAHQEALQLQIDYPEIVENIPNLEEELLKVAKGVQTSREELMTAVYKYSSKEPDQFRKLELTPSAKLFEIGKEEKLCVDGKDYDEINHLDLVAPPVNAKESPLLQQETSLEKLIDEAKEVQAYIKSVVLPRSDWSTREKAGSSGADKWKESGFLCDEVLDPGPKENQKRIKAKCKRYDGKFERNRDYARLGMIYDTVEHLILALPKFLHGIGDGIRLATIENRFAQPHPLGWRDINLLLKVKVPSKQSWHIMEVQMMLRELKELRPMNHKIYENVRIIPDDALTRIMDRLVSDTTLDLNMNKKEWNQCLDNREVKELLDHFSIPIPLRKRLFDLIDLSDSGTVSSAELQELLRLHRIPAQHLEIIACNLRVRELQRFNRLKLKDEISRPIIKQIKQSAKLDDHIRRSISDSQSARPSGSLELQYVRNSFIEGKRAFHLRCSSGSMGSIMDESIVLGDDFPVASI